MVMAKTQTFAGRSYRVSDYLKREEEDGFLIFVKQTQQCYVVNEVGALILQLVGEGYTVEQVYSYLADSYIYADRIRGQVAEYISQMLLYGIIHEVDEKVQKKEYMMSPPLLPLEQDFKVKEYMPPSLLPLEQAFKKGKQCRLFGMP